MKRIISALLVLCMATGLLYAGGFPVSAVGEDISSPPWPKRTGEWFASANEAARDFALTYMIFQFNEGVEIGTTIYRKFNWKTFKMGYSYSNPHRGTANSANVTPPIWIFLLPFLYDSYIHTHPSTNNFSEGDFTAAKAWDIIFPFLQCAYVVTPNGCLRKYNPRTKANEMIYSDLDYFSKYEEFRLV